MTDQQAKIFQKHKNHWVVTDKSREQILLSDKSLDNLHKKIKKEKVKGGTIMYVPDPNSSLAPSCLL